MQATETQAGTVAKQRSPWVFVPSLYFMEGLPYILVNLVSVPMLKSLGATNELIGLTSLLYLPWTLKPLWSPLVEARSSKRRWILAAQLAVALIIGILALAMASPFPVMVALILFVPLAFASATHDIAADGFYLDTLNLRQQAAFVGIQAAGYKVAWLAGTGGIVTLAGVLARNGTSIADGWMVAFGLAAVGALALLGYHLWALPRSQAQSTTAGRPKFGAVFWDSFKSYLGQPKILAILGFILLFRLGDALMLKMAPLFLMDQGEKGGLGLGTDQVGFVYGTIGTLFLLAGGIVGGLLVAKGGLKKWMWPLALIQNGLILLYWALAVFRPGLTWVAVLNAFEQFAYGLGDAAYTVFLMRTVKRGYKATHYAIATSFMAVGVMVPGAVSGFLQSALGYGPFFLLSFALAIPGMLLLFFVPYREAEG